MKKKQPTTTDAHVHAFAVHAGLSFSDENVLATALTHRSYVNEHRGEVTEHNERLEFLGDAVLELVITEALFSRYPHKSEGDLTAYRAALVNTESLANAAEALGVNEYLRLSKGESKDTGRARRFILANAFEALIGALNLDQGYAAARAFIERTLLPKIDEIVEKKLWQDPKSAFQERAQALASVTPRYETLTESGPDHDKWFVVGVYLDTELIAKGEGKAKQEAEQNAASHGLIAKGW